MSHCITKSRSAIRHVVRAFFAALATTPLISMAQADVAIDGGTDKAGHQYKWTVTNKHTLPIRAIIFPQSNADLCLPPDGWTSELTKDSCSFRSESGAEAIAPGRNADFQMRISPRGARRGKGSVFVEFVDGSQTSVGDVQIAQAESAGDQFVPLIGMSVVLVVVVLWQVRANRRKQTATS